MKTDRPTLLVVGVAAVVLVGTLGLVVGVPGLDGGDSEPTNAAGPDGNADSDESEDGESDTDERDTESDGGDDDSDRVEFDGEEPIELDPADATISGTADVDSGTELGVQLMTAPGEDSPFFMQQTTTAGEGGDFEAEFEFDANTAEEGTEAEVVVRVDGESETLGNATVTLAEATDDESDTKDDGGDDDSDRVEFDGEEPIELDPADATISGTADVDEGTGLGVQLMTAPGEDSPFFMQQTTTAGEGGDFEVEFEFDANTAEEGTEAEVIVSIAGESEELGVADVVLDEPSEELESPPTAEEVLDLDHEEPVELTAGNNTLSGSAEELAADEELTVVVLGAPDTDPVEATATVDEDGTFTVELDLSEVEPGTDVDVRFIHPNADGSLLLDGTVVE